MRCGKVGRLEYGKVEEVNKRAKKCRFIWAPHLQSGTHPLIPVQLLHYVTISYTTSPYHTLPYVTIPYHTLRHHIIHYIAISYTTLPYVTIHCHICMAPAGRGPLILPLHTFPHILGLLPKICRLTL